jgi:hypothetical protein
MRNGRRETEEEAQKKRAMAMAMEKLSLVCRNFGRR